MNDAMGMATPDEVVMIHYSSIEEGNDFRNANQDIEQMAGLFNKTHLTGFTYLFGTADK